jgi:hypothetical protein
MPIAKEKNAKFDGSSSVPMFFQRGDQSYKTLNFSTRLRGDKRKQSDMHYAHKLSREINYKATPTCS